MPRPIANIGVGNPATYTLSPNETFTVLAVTFSLTPLSGAGGDNFAWLDYRDPHGGIIYLQPLAPGDGADMFYSLAVGASEFGAEYVPTPMYPQNADGSGYYYITQKLSPVTLYGNCTLNAYKTLGAESPPTDPITAVSSFYVIPDLHLWVEDVGTSRTLPPAPEPLLTHVGNV